MRPPGCWSGAGGPRADGLRQTMFAVAAVILGPWLIETLQVGHFDQQPPRLSLWLIQRRKSQLFCGRVHDHAHALRFDCVPRGVICLTKVAFAPLSAVKRPLSIQHALL